MQKQFLQPFPFCIFENSLDMLKLIIDQGNTCVKVALFEGEKMREQAVLQQLSQLTPWLEKADAVMISTVREEEELLSFLEGKPHLFLSHTTVLPIQNAYQTPQTLGKDRLAVVVAAAMQYPETPTLVIDCGTCITYDLIDKNACYQGGAISPGVHMRYKAMHQQTAKLPLVDKLEPVALIGDDTISSMHSGVMNGVLAEIDGIIERYKEQYPALTVIMTGGDHQLFDKDLKNTIFADPHLVLKGLNEIYTHNEKHF